MYRFIRNNPMFKCKQICLLFIFLTCSLTQSYCQISSGEEDLVIDNQDSFSNWQRVQDSINYNYLIPGNFRHANYLLDSIKAIVVVDDNNFVEWISNMNALKSHDNIYEPSEGPLKNKRPLWLLLVILVLFIGVGLVRFFFYMNFQNIVYGFYDSRVFQQLNKEDSLLTSWPYIFLYGIFAFSCGLLLLVLNNVFLDQNVITFVSFLKVSLAISLFFILKIIIIRFIGLLFELEKIVREYIVFLYLLYFNSVLIIIPLLLMIVLLPVDYLRLLFILFLVLGVMVLVYRALSFFINLIGARRLSIIYLILYICTLEIAPILILVKTLSK